MAALATPLDWTGGPALLWVLGAALLYRLGGRGRPAAPGGGLARRLLPRRAGRDRPRPRLAGRRARRPALLGPHGPAHPSDRRGARRCWPWPAPGPGCGAASRSPSGAPSPARSPAAARRRSGGAPRLAGGAVVSWLLFNLNFCAWHLPVLYDAALRWEFVHALEHLTFFATGAAVLDAGDPSPPWRSSLGELGKLAYLGSTLVVGWVLAIVLALAASPLYSPYVEVASRPGHISALTDQQLAAGVMWVPGGLAYLIAIVVIAYRWLEPRECAGPQGPRRGPCREELDEMQLVPRCSRTPAGRASPASSRPSSRWSS